MSAWRGGSAQSRAIDAAKLWRREAFWKGEAEQQLGPRLGHCFRTYDGLEPFGIVVVMSLRCVKGS